MFSLFKPSNHKRRETENVKTLGWKGSRCLDDLLNHSELLFPPIYM